MYRIGGNKDAPSHLAVTGYLETKVNIFVGAKRRVSATANSAAAKANLARSDYTQARPRTTGNVAVKLDRSVNSNGATAAKSNITGEPQESAAVWRIPQFALWRARKTTLSGVEWVVSAGVQVPCAVAGGRGAEGCTGNVQVRDGAFGSLGKNGVKLWFNFGPSKQSSVLRDITLQRLVRPLNRAVDITADRHRI